MYQFPENVETGTIEEKILKHINDSRWKFASSMPKYPHWYTLAEWMPGRYEDFKLFAKFIRENGYAGNFWRKQLIYLNIGEFKYWTMGCPIQDCLSSINPKIDTMLINRAHL